MIQPPKSCERGAAATPLRLRSRRAPQGLTTNHERDLCIVGCENDHARKPCCKPMPRQGFRRAAVATPARRLCCRDCAAVLLHNQEPPSQCLRGRLCCRDPQNSILAGGKSWSQCLRGGFVAATSASTPAKVLVALVAMPARRLCCRDGHACRKSIQVSSSQCLRGGFVAATQLAASANSSRRRRNACAEALLPRPSPGSDGKQARSVAMPARRLCCRDELRKSEWKSGQSGGSITQLPKGKP